MVWGRGARLDRGPGVLPDRARARLRLRAPAVAVQESKAPIRSSRLAAARQLSDVADRSRRVLEARTRKRAGGQGSRSARHDRGLAVLSAGFDRAATTEVADRRTRGRCPGAENLSPVCVVEFRLARGAAVLSVRRRAVCAATRAGGAVESGVRALHNQLD